MAHPDRQQQQGAAPHAPPRHSPSLSGRGEHQELCQLNALSLAEFASLVLKNLTLNPVPTCAELLTGLAAVLLQVSELCKLPAPGQGETRGSGHTCTTCTKLSIQLVPSLFTNLLSILPLISIHSNPSICLSSHGFTLVPLGNTGIWAALGEQGESSPTHAVTFWLHVGQISSG